MNTYTVLLNDGSVGHVTSANAPRPGYEMSVTVYDKYGEASIVTGVVKDILEEKLGRGGIESN